MNCIVPFSKEIKFNSNIGEISSISLEHEHNLNKETLLGNFIVSGEFKTHELSVNKEEFSYTLPFDVTLNNEVIEDTFSFEIDDFKYYIEKPDILKVEIDFLIKGDEVEELREENVVFEKEPDDLTTIFEDPKIIEEEITLIDERKEVLESDYEDDLKSTLESEIEEINEEEPKEEPQIRVEVEIEEKTEVGGRIHEDNQAAILNFGQKNEESFVTYNIHTVKEGESIESICKIYNKNENYIKDYNMISKVNIGDKLLIPQDE